MKRFKVFLEKTFKDLNPKKGEVKNIKKSDFKRSKFGMNLSDELFDLIQSTYKKIGGHIKIKNKNDVPGNIPDWQAIDIDGDKDPDITFASKITKAGKKSIATATDGSTEAKKEMLNLKSKELNKLGNYAEVSEAMAHVLITRFDIPFVDNEKDVEKVLNKNIEWVGANPNGKYPKHKGWYNRKISGKKHLKIMVGKPKL